jgi:hypothetical protein
LLSVALEAVADGVLLVDASALGVLPVLVAGAFMSVLALVWLLTDGVETEGVETDGAVTGGAVTDGAETDGAGVVTALSVVVAVVPTWAKAGMASAIAATASSGRKVKDIETSPVHQALRTIRLSCCVREWPAIVAAECGFQGNSVILCGDFGAGCGVGRKAKRIAPFLEGRATECASFFRPT